MKFAEIRIGQKVFDRWYPEWGIGTITNVLKTFTRIQFPCRTDLTTYDRAHVQFLDNASRDKK